MRGFLVSSKSLTSFNILNLKKPIEDRLDFGIFSTLAVKTNGEVAERLTLKSSTRTLPLCDFKADFSIKTMIYSSFSAPVKDN